MSNLFVYPPRNLPGRAEDWGRAVEARDAQFEKDLGQAVQKMDNGLRATSGQLAVMAGQIDTLAVQQADLQAQQQALQSQQEELILGRRSYTATPSALSISASTPGEFPTYTREFSLPGPYSSGRSALFSVSLSFRRTSSSGNMTVWTELLRGTSVIWRRSSAVVVGDTLSAPPAWGNPGFSDTISIPTPSESTDYALRFHTHTFTSGTVNGIVENMSVTVTYGDTL